MAKLITFDGSGLGTKKRARLAVFVDGFLWPLFAEEVCADPIVESAFPAVVDGQQVPAWYTGSPYPSSEARQALIDWWLERVLRAHVLDFERFTASQEAMVLVEEI